MQLRFIFMVAPGEERERAGELEYVERMASFFGFWIKKRFSRELETGADMMVASRGSLFRRLDTHVLLDDHRSRDPDTYHFYLANFRPFWTDCTCEGYHAENFGMSWWQRPGPEDGTAFLAEKNCTVVSHEIAHELLRQAGVKKHAAQVHDVWTRHFYDNLAFEAYDRDHNEAAKDPEFMTIDTATLG